MSRGRPKKPIAVHLAEGNPSHLTEAEIEERKEQELVVPFKNVKAPAYLNTKQKRKFTSVSKKLVALGIMTELDVDCLARYIISHDLYLKYTEEINEMLEHVETSLLTLRDVQNMQDKAFKQAQTSARDLGLTITSRCKLVIPTPPEEDDEL